MNAHTRFASATVGFGTPDTIDPHCFEVRIPRGKTGEVRIVEHYGVAAGAFGRPEIERCVMPRAAWAAIADDLKRAFNERLKEKHLAVGVWKAGATRVERLLGQEMLVLAWGVEAVSAALIPTAVRNWLAMRPEERWWLYAITAASTGEPKHSEIGWRKALRFALTENPVREALERSEPAEEAPATAPVRGKGKSKKPREIVTPLFPGFEEEASPFLIDAPRLNGAHEETHAATLFVEERAVADRAGDPGAKDLNGSGKRARRKAVPNPDASGRVLEGTKAPRAKQGVRTRRAVARDG